MLSDKRLNITRAEKKVKSPAHRLLAHLREISDAQGLFELNADQIAQRLAISRRTVYLTLGTLQRQGLVEPVELRRGRGRHSLYRLKIKQKNKPRQIDEKTVNKKCAISKSKAHEIDEKTVNKKCAISKIRNINKIKHSKDSSRCLGGGSNPRREPTDYVGLEAAKVTLILGSRFYRFVMRETRLSLEGWELPEPLCVSLQGLLGRLLDGASLDYARQLVSQIWALRREIEALARSGASPRRVCAFVGGRLAKTDRAKREILRRTGALIRESLDLELIERRLSGLRRFAAEREAEYRAGQVCKRCGYKHSQLEYTSGYRADGTGTLSCFGWVRIKLDELHEQLKIAERRRRELLCRSCGGSLRDGHVEGYCWECWAA